MRLEVSIWIKYPPQTITDILPTPQSAIGSGTRGPHNLRGDNQHYPHWSGGRHHGGPGRGDGGPLDDPYAAGSNSSSSKSEIRWKHDWHLQQHDQFEQSMIAMNKVLIDLLNYQQQTQDNTPITRYPLIPEGSCKWYLNLWHTYIWWPKPYFDQTLKL